MTPMMFTNNNDFSQFIKLNSDNKEINLKIVDRITITIWLLLMKMLLIY